MNDLKFDKDKIKYLCQKHKIKILILHGSQVSGKTSKNSDIDVGILCDSKVDFKEYRAILADFGDIFGDKFDPVFLNGVEPMISYNTALSGFLLYEAKKGCFAEYKIQTIARYMDARKFRELEKLYVKKGTKR